MELIEGPWPEGFSPCNPSIAQGPDGYALMVTCRNLYLDDNATPVWLDNYIQTKNFFSLLDDDLHPLGWVELPNPDVPVLFEDVRGIEDPRLYWDNEWMFTGSIREHHPNGEHRIAISSVKNGLLKILDAEEGTWVKNLMPAADGVLFDAMEQDYRLHGGAVVRDGDSWLGIVHEICPGRVYHHRFVRLDEAGDLQNLSELFSFTGRPIEFASGIVTHRRDVVVSFGVLDREVLLARFPLEYVRGLL